ncbi:MAG: DUF937 domain-containing protein [Oscillospiraceae bacterium]|nr:DUF937 domain-containing protein [Oscillospiraceae bacterium]
MADFNLNSIGSLLSGGGVSAISKRTKLPKEDVAKVLSAGIPALVGGMRRNAGAAAGEASLSRALKDHSAADISNPGAFLKSSDLQDGKKILGHVLGDDQKELVEEISRASGVTKAKTTTILALVAPLLLSLLGNQNNSSGGGLLSMLGGLLGMGGGQSSGGLLGSLFGGGQSQPQPQQQSGSLLGSLLGGSSSSNASMASGLFSSLLGGGSSNQSASPIQLVDNAPQQQEESSGLLDSFLSLFH